MTTYARLAKIGPIKPQTGAELLKSSYFLYVLSSPMSSYLYKVTFFSGLKAAQVYACLRHLFIGKHRDFFFFFAFFACYSQMLFQLEVYFNSYNHFLAIVCHSRVLKRPMADGGAVDSHFWLKHLSPTFTNKHFSSKENLSKTSFDFQDVFCSKNLKVKQRNSKASSKTFFPKRTISRPIIGL